MFNLKTHLCGIELSSPIVLASSPITEKIAGIANFCEMGIGAIITKSITVEEKSRLNNVGSRRTYLDGHGMWACSTYLRESIDVEDGVKLIKLLSKNSGTPIIASVCGLSPDIDRWFVVSKKLIKAGATAIQIDSFYLPQPIVYSSNVTNLKNLCKQLYAALSVPILLKLNVQLPAYFVADTFSDSEISGLSLLDSIRVPSPMAMSNGCIQSNFKYIHNLGMASLFGSWQYPLTLHYTFILSKKTNFDLCSGGGVWRPEEVFNLIAHGARCVQIATSGICEGPKVVFNILEGLKKLMMSNNIPSIDELHSIYNNYCRTDVDEGECNYDPVYVQSDISKCTGCKSCQEWYFCNALKWDNTIPEIDYELCEGCGFCVNKCPNGVFGYNVIQNKRGTF